MTLQKRPRVGAAIRLGIVERAIEGSVQRGALLGIEPIVIDGDVDDRTFG